MPRRSRPPRRNVLDESDSEGAASASGSGSGSELETEETGNPYIDLEADDQSDSHDGSVEEIEVKDPFSFSSLPPELRLRIWEYFCPDLRANGRALDFSLLEMTETSLLTDGRCLADQTEEIRIVQSVNRESREIALKKYPDTLMMHNEMELVEIYFDRHTDIIMIDNYSSELDSYGLEYAVNVGINWQSALYVSLRAMSKSFPSMENLFFTYDEGDLSEYSSGKKHLRWCASDMTTRYDLITTEKMPGVGEDITVVACWPNVKQHWSWAKSNVPKSAIHQEVEDSLGADEISDLGLELWPLLQFYTDRGKRKLQHLIDIKDVPVLDDDSDDDDDDDEGRSEDGSEEDEEGPDEYESDGIDDTEHPEVFDEEDGLPSSEDEAEVTARFSSPEGSDQSTSRRRKRRIVESDDEDEDEGPSTKRQRTIVIDSDDTPDRRRGKQRATIIDSDDDTPAKKRNAIVIESDESAIENGSDDDELVTKRKGRKTVVVDSDSEQDSEDGFEEALAIGQKMTLARRLRGKQSITVDSDSEEGSEEEEDEDDDDEEEEEEEEEEDEDEEEEEDGGGFLDTMAAESESE